ncbi:MAG: alpha/beta hydrolase [Planctomycetota bacterium]
MGATTVTPLILLPGLGADAQLLEPQRAFFPGLATPPWPAHVPGETLRDYAQRAAAAITPLLPAGGGYHLGGCSFGGMVALEAVAHLPVPPRAIFLIASARSGQAIAPHLRYFVKFASILPERAFAAGQALTPLFMQKFGRLSPEQADWFAAILAGVDAGFVRWGIAAITDWEGCELPPDVPVHTIHGSDDELIPCKQVRPDVVIQGGGHLISVTHADEVNRFIAERLGTTG